MPYVDITSQIKRDLQGDEDRKLALQNQIIKGLDKFGDIERQKKAAERQAAMDEMAKQERDIKLAKLGYVSPEQQAATQQADQVLSESAAQTRMAQPDLMGPTQPTPEATQQAQQTGGFGKFLTGVAERGQEQRAIQGQVADLGLKQKRLAVDELTSPYSESRGAEKFTYEQDLRQKGAERLAGIKAKIDQGVASRKEKQQFKKATNDLRKEIKTNPAYQAFQKVDTAYKKIEGALRRGDAAGDMAGIFNYMKILDPGSTVREGEFATAENTRGWSETGRALYNKARDGVRLTPKQRTEFIEASQGLYGAQVQNYEMLMAPYIESARANNLPIKEIFPTIQKSPGGVANNKQKQIFEKEYAELTPQQAAEEYQRLLKIKQDKSGYASK